MYYLIFFTILFFVLEYVYFNIFYSNLIEFDLNNARYLLSSMAQGQAALFAIVMSFSVVAVQLASSVYSPRIITMFKNNADVWILSIWFFTSIIYDLAILRVLTIDINEFYIFLSYWLCASSFIALFFYIYSVMNILTPEAIIKRLANDIPDSLAPVPNLGDWLLDDPFQTIIDIITISLKKSDCATVKIGLERMTTKTTQIIKTFDLDRLKKKKIGGIYPDIRSHRYIYDEFIRYYCTHIKHLNELQEDINEELTLDLIKKLEEIGADISKGKIGAETNVIRALKDIGVISVKRGYQEATNRTLNVLGDIATSVPSEEYEDYVYFNIMESIVFAADEISIPAVKKWGTFELQTAGKLLEKVGVILAKKGERYVWETVRVTRIFITIGFIILNIKDTVLKYNPFFLSDFVIKPLSRIGRISYEKGVKKGFEHSVYALWEIGIGAMLLGSNENADTTAEILADFGLLDEKIVNQELENVKYNQNNIESLKDYNNFLIKMKVEYLNKLAEKTTKNKNKEAKK